MSSQPLNHSYSFERSDEASLQPGRSQAQQPVQQQQYQAYQPYQHAQPYRDDYSGSTPPQQQYTPYVGGPSPPPREHDNVSPPSFHPAAHPDSAYSRLQALRKYSVPSGSPPLQQSYDSQDRAADYAAELPSRGEYGFPTQGGPPPSSHRNQIPRAPVGAAYSSVPAATGTLTSGPTPQPPPSHPELPLPTDFTASRSQSPPQQTPQSPSRLVPPAPATDNNGRYWGRELGYSNSTRTTASATPGMDNLGDGSVGGGITGLAMGVAATNERESGLQALRAIENGGHAGPPGQEGTPSTMRPYEQERLTHRSSYGSTVPLGAAAAMMPAGGSGSSRMNVSDDGSFGSHPSQDRFLGDVGGNYADNPYNQYSTTWDPRVSQTGFVGINPHDIADDGDDGLNYSTQDPKRRSVLSLGRGTGAGGAAVAGGAAAGGVLGALGGLVGRNSGIGTRGANGATGSQYGLVSTTGETEFGGGPEKSEWLNKESTGNKKMKWIVGILITLLILGAVAGGIVGGVLGSKKNSNGSSSSSSSSAAVGADAAAAAAGSSGDLNKNSAEIKKLMNNPNLHQVFPGMDYTPLNAAQYPECLTIGPNQNNVTRDIAVLSQLTKTIRLYGTDCNQTEMTLHSIQALGVDMKVWLGVWQDNNATTNARQLDQMYDLLDKYGTDPFAGVIIGNEVLFRKDMTEWQLEQVITGVRANFTAKSISLPIASADLGDNWTATLAEAVDVVMANVHPFFAGVTADAATGWAWNFWQTHDVALTASLPKPPKHIISEIGWPSGGGNDCGTATPCPDKTSGSVAGIPEMNTFMNDFVCQALNNGTDYFWFEAFDEPWKIQFDKGSDNWEDKWGLMDVDRNLKPGVGIPSCGGKTISR